MDNTKEIDNIDKRYHVFGIYFYCLISLKHWEIIFLENSQQNNGFLC
ncbi:TPA: hypothetical protein ACXDAZ_001243 [Clostridium botulinum]|nr:hypothetical protein [Clostridium botulinum]MCS4520572.1 hypothetical protein [Clostridium botulinum]